MKELALLTAIFNILLPFSEDVYAKNPYINTFTLRFA